MQVIENIDIVIIYVFIHIFLLLHICSETMALMENIAEQVVKEVEDHLSENEKPPLPTSAKVALKSQVLEIKSPDHRIRALISKCCDLQLVIFNQVVSDIHHILL